MAAPKVRAITADVTCSVSLQYQSTSYFAIPTSLAAHPVFLLQELLLVESKDR